MQGANADQDADIRIVPRVLQNAASIAGLILATDCMIAKAPENPVSPGEGEGEGMAE